MSKRNLLLGGRVEIRPPWSVAADEFVKACSRCGRCVDACPEGILVLDRFEYPRIDFNRGGCSFCGVCRQVCLERPDITDGNVLPFDSEDSPWAIKAHIGESCLAGRGILCRSCGEECERRAITFRLQTGGFAKPGIDEQLCSGCGACLYICPVQAVRLL